MFCLVFERQGGEIGGRRGVVDGRLGNKTEFEDQDEQIKTNIPSRKVELFVVHREREDWRE